MRFLFLLIVALNLALFAFGQGLFGPAPAEQGRSARLLQERNAQALTIGNAELDTAGTRANHSPNP